MYGQDMWLFRDHTDRGTTRALNSYKGEQRGYSVFCSLACNKLTVFKFRILNASHQTDTARLTANEAMET